MNGSRTVSVALTVAGILAVLPAGCGLGGQGATGSGVAGSVRLGPQCPVVVEGEPCADAPAAGVPVLVAEQLPGEAYALGEVVARARTDRRGRFTVVVPPGDYVVTAQAGMSCELMDVTVVPGRTARVVVPCDTGIR